MASLLLPGSAAASGITNSGDDLRTGWYPDQPSLTPEVVAGGDFGEQWAADVVGQVYSQPLVADGSVLVTTEANRAYGLDPATGAVRWHRELGTPWNPTDLGCGDLTPEVGSTATPVIDTATSTAYLTTKTYVSGASGPARWDMHALDVATGAERSGFPVELTGTADNATLAFDAAHHLQRPGLLLLDGVVYAAFGGHCDAPPWQGWVFGVSTAGATTARWVAVGSDSGAGIWQSGAGLMSDGPGRILLGTGNGGTPPKPAAGTSAPTHLGQSVVRLQVQPGGRLAVADFFAPFDAATLDEWDADFASGGPVGLPDAYFGTPAFPHLAVAVGKQGYVYLLDRDHLGGIAQGPDGSDAVIQRIGPYGGVWSRPGVWPGDGGWVYIPTSSGGATGSGSSGFLEAYRYDVTGERPALTRVARSADPFGFSSSAPVITSDGTVSGSALLWTVWTGGGSGANAQLRAYDPRPVAGHVELRWSAPVGTSAKFAMPGVGAGRIFVGTRDGKVRAFGSPATPPVSAPQLAYPTTTVGETSTRTLTLTANADVVVSSIASSSSHYVVGTPDRTLPATLAAGAKLRVPVTFGPASSGVIAGTITIKTDKGDAHVGTSGTGQAAGPELAIAPPAVTFEGTPTGGHAAGSVTFRNTGGRPLTIEAVRLPSAPFGHSGAPAVGQVIQPGAAVAVDVRFDPTTAGDFTDLIGVDSDGGDGDVGLSGTAGTPGRLTFSSEAVACGAVPYGTTQDCGFTLGNSGDTAVTITKSKPPAGAGFTVSAGIPEGTVVAPHGSVTGRVRYAPTRIGPQAAAWQITGNDSSGPHAVAFTAAGSVPWQLNGSATLQAGALELTPAAASQAGTAFWPARVDPRSLAVEFDVAMNGGTGADGAAFIVGDAMRGARPTALGASGGALAFGGAPGVAGVAVAFDTYGNAGDPSDNFVGIADGATTAPDALHWLATAAAPAPLRSGTHHVRITTGGGILAVELDDTRVLEKPVALPPAAYVGFGAGTGESTDRHAVTNLQIDGASPPPPAALAIRTAVVAPAGAPQGQAKLSYTGACPSAFAAGPQGDGATATPALTGARAGEGCSVAQTAPSGPGWTFTAAVDGGAPVELAPQDGAVSLPELVLGEGTSTVTFTSTWRPAADPAAPDAPEPAAPSAPDPPAPPPPPPAPRPPAGLVGSWSFSEGAGRTVRDGSGNGNTGTIAGARWATAGRFGSALRFDGRRRRVTIPRSPSLRLTRAMTLEAWVRPGRTGSGWRGIVIGAPAYGLYASSGSRAPAARAIAGGERTSRGDRSVPARRWTHLAATWDGRVLRLYVDGVRVGARRLGGTLARSSGALRIGGRGFAGLIDEVRVYDRALGAAEIAADMQR